MSEVAPLARLFAAMSPQARAATPAPDVGAIAAAAEAQGHARGLAEGEASLAPLRARLAVALAAVEAAAIVDPEMLAPLFVDLVTRVARAVVGGELRLSGEAVERLVAAGLAAVECAGDAVVFVAGGDAPLICDAIVDQTLAPGEIRVETPRQVVAASLEARLADIVAGLA